jgi:hypothetical protein
MLWDHTDSICKGTLLFILFAWVCAAYAYLVNSRRAGDDPDKKEFYLAAVFLTPITIIPFLVGYILIFIVRALFYSIFLVVFIFALIVIRNAFLLEWLHKKATSIGNKLLAANTLLIKLFLRPWVSKPI